MKEEVKILQGNEAVVDAAIAAGCRFFAGYPITPASEIAEQMALKLPLNDGIYMQMEDEIASIMGVVGSTWGGMKACTATSGPGFSLMQEGIGFAAMTETPCVIIDVMRGGPATGQPTLASQQDVMQAKYGAHGDYEVITLCPSSVQEAYDLTITAFNLAETYRVPVIILSDEIVGHTREKIRISTNPEVVERTRPQTPPESYKPYEPLESGLLDGMPAFGQGYKLLIDGQCHDGSGNRAGNDPVVSGKLVQRLCEKITGHAKDLENVEGAFLDDAESVVFAYGSVARSALDAVKKARAQGFKAGFIRAKILWPFPDQAIMKAIRNASRIIVPEINIGKICREIERLATDDQEVVSLPKMGGVLHRPDEIIDAVMTR